MNDYRDTLTVQELREKYSLLDVYIDKLEKENQSLVKRHIELENSLIELRKYHQEFDKYAYSIYDPNKSTYKELEDKLALAENSKQTEIDELYETQIIPLKNQVKDRDIQLESKYKQEIRYGEQIRSLKSAIDNLNTIINYAVGYISACEQFREYHPQYVKLWLFKGMKDNQ